MKKYVKINEKTTDVTNYLNARIEVLVSLIKRGIFVKDGKFDEELFYIYQREVYIIIGKAYDNDFIDVKTWSELYRKTRSLKSIATLNSKEV